MKRVNRLPEIHLCVCIFFHVPNAGTFDCGVCTKVCPHVRLRAIASRLEAIASRV